MHNKAPEFCKRFPVNQSALSRQSVTRLIEIDYLRAYAVAFVVFLHVVGAYMGMSPKAEKFFGNTHFDTGVDIFFAVSGYVISKSLKDFWLPNDYSLSVKIEHILLFLSEEIYQIVA